MRLLDIFAYTWNALTRHRLRTMLMLLAMTIGVASILVLTALGEGARQYVINEFSSLGTNLIITIPGKTETKGINPSIFIGETPRDLTNDDAKALLRISGVKRIAPLVLGSAMVSRHGVERESPIMGSSHSLMDILHWTLASGRFLPESDFNQASPVCVIGSTIRKQLFGTQNPIGEWLRIGDRRFRVIGVLASEGRAISLDVQDLVITPVSSAQALFNTSSLLRIFTEAKTRSVIPYVINEITATLKKRHQGKEDVTIITQDAVLSTFDKILTALTYSVAGIATISLAVAGILIMNIMLISVSQRTAEIGLLKALGANRRKIVVLFLAESTMIASLGALLGLLLGGLTNTAIEKLYPSFPVGAPMWASVGAVLVAISTGLIFGSMPAKRAAQLNPIDALSHR